MFKKGFKDTYRETIQDQFCKKLPRCKDILELRKIILSKIILKYTKSMKDNLTRKKKIQEDHKNAYLKDRISVSFRNKFLIIFKQKLIFVFLVFTVLRDEK